MTEVHRRVRSPGRHVDILLVHPSDELYGADRVLLAVARALANQHSIEVWLPTDINYPDHKLCIRLEAIGVSTRHLPMPVLRRAGLTPSGVIRTTARAVRMLASLWRSQARVVWVNTVTLAPVVPLARISRAKVVVHIHEIPRPREAALLAYLIGPAHRILTVSLASRDAFPPAVRKRAEIVQNAVSGPPEPPALPSTASPLHLLYMGRWSSRKGVLDAVRAVMALPEPSVMMTVLGGTPPSGEGVDVRALAGTDPRIRVVGEVDDVGPFLTSCHVLVVPSIEPDPSPLVVREAAAWGRPSVVTEAGGLPELVEHGVTGWVVPSSNPGALRSAIAGITHLDVLERGAAARDRWEREWQPRQFTETVCEVASRLLGTAPPGTK